MKGNLLVKIFGIALLGLLYTQIGHSQDRHFSQIFSNPLYLSPGLTGAFDGSYRTSMLYRSQWFNAVENPFKTFSLSADLNFKIAGKNTFKGDRVGAGVQFFADKVNGFDFNTNQISLFGAYHKMLDANTNQFLSLGFQMGIAQKNVNYSGLSFGDQFVDGSGYVNATGEPLQENNFAYGDYSLGVNYSIEPDDRISVSVGYAFHHISKPNISFYKDLPDEQIINNNELLDSKHSVFLIGELSNSHQISLLPRTVVQWQGDHFEWLVGTNTRLGLTPDQSFSLYLGGWLRVSNQLETIGLESATLFAGVGTGPFLIGLSYDNNLSKIAEKFGQRSSFEISLILLGSYDNEGIFCPKF